MASMTMNISTTYMAGTQLQHPGSVHSSSR